VTLRNDGERTIKSIDWDYIFIDPITKQELARHQFTSDERIKSGKSKEVSVLYFISPVKTVDARLLKKRMQCLLLSRSSLRASNSLTARSGSTLKGTSRSAQLTDDTQTLSKSF